MQYRLKKARLESKLSQAKVAKALNTTQQQIAKYETGKQEIPFYRAIELAELYGCSLDYLAGRTELRNLAQV